MNANKFLTTKMWDNMVLLAQMALGDICQADAYDKDDSYNGCIESLKQNFSNISIISSEVELLIISGTLMGIFTAVVIKHKKMNWKDVTNEFEQWLSSNESKLEEYGNYSHIPMFEYMLEVLSQSPLEVKNER